MLPQKNPRLNNLPNPNPKLKLYQCILIVMPTMKKFNQLLNHLKTHSKTTPNSCLPSTVEVVTVARENQKSFRTKTRVVVVEKEEEEMP